MRCRWRLAEHNTHFLRRMLSIHIQNNNGEHYERKEMKMWLRDKLQLFVYMSGDLNYHLAEPWRHFTIMRRSGYSLYAPNNLKLATTSLSVAIQWHLMERNSKRPPLLHLERIFKRNVPPNSMASHTISSNQKPVTEKRFRVSILGLCSHTII